MSPGTLLAVKVGCDFVYEVNAEAPAVLLVRALDRDAILEERWETEPAVPHHDYRDIYGNTPRRLTMPPGRFAFRYDAHIGVPPEPAAVNWSARNLPVADLPDDVLLFTLPSRYCESDALATQAWELFGNTGGGWAAVQAICDWVHDHIGFRYGASGPQTTARDVLAAGFGVCRDYAHVAISFCRALNIPARYAFGYLPDIGVPPPDAPMDFCAWFEAYLEDRWWTFDPRNNQRRIGHITIGRGRDALDVAMATTYGAATLKSMSVWADRIE